MARFFLTVVCFVLVLSAWRSTAAAYHLEGIEHVHGTAHTLDRDEWRLGLTRLDYGIVDSLQIGTFTLPWLILLANVDLKWRMWANRRWAIALRTGVARLDTTVINLFLPDDLQSDAVLWSVPVELDVSARLHPKVLVSLQTQLAYVHVRGSYDAQEADGAAAASALQLKPSLEWRLSRITALLFQFRCMLLRYVDGSGSATTDLDEVTQVETQAAASVELPPFDESIGATASAHFSWRTFNLRAGLSVGTYEIPVVQLVITKFRVLPVLELFWRW